MDIEQSMDYRESEENQQNLQNPWFSSINI